MGLPIIVLILLLLHQALSAKILFVLTSPSPSHAAIVRPIYKELSLRGHQVTVLTPSPLYDKALKNLTEIELAKYEDIHSHFKGRFVKYTNDLSSLLIFAYSAENLKKATIETLIKAKNTFGGTEFDLLILENLSPLIYGLGCRFQVPIIGLSVNFLLSFTHDSLGNPDHPILYPDWPGRNDFFNKVFGIIGNVLIKTVGHWLYLPRLDSAMREVFGQDCPRIDKIIQNVSLMLANTQPFLHPIRSHLPGIIEMGGLLHIETEKPLPQDLQTYLDQSPQGFIYFSLGSVLKSSDLSDAVLDTIMRALSELPYNVLWKFENDSLSNLPDNVMIRKWLPQQDVLRHKNIKAFVTPVGLLSSEEAIFYSVPLVAIPLVMDQPGNAMRVVELGIGRSVEYSTMTKDVLKDAIMEVAGNARYKDAIREVSKLLQDRPMKSLDNVIWWIEYVIRTKGAHHLKSTTAFTPWYEFFFVDLILVMLLCMVLIFYTMYFFIKCTRALFN